MCAKCDDCVGCDDYCAKCGCPCGSMRTMLEGEISEEIDMNYANEAREETLRETVRMIERDDSELIGIIILENLGFRLQPNKKFQRIV